MSRRVELSPGLEYALGRARLWAFQGQASEVSPSHLLLALIEDEAKPAWQRLQRSGVSRESVLAWFLPSPNEELVPGEIPFDRVSASVLRTAAIGCFDEPLTSDQVLLALLEEHSASRDPLVKLGLDFPRFKEAIRPELPPLPLPEPLLLTDPVEEVDAARIIDANANRAREGLRVLEDHARFVLNDAFLSGELKSLRHGLAEALALIPTRLLLAGRDTNHDVGTAISTQAELHRESLSDVVQANSKRLEESLRSLEEFGKILSPQFGQQIEKLRYRVYTLERNLIRHDDAKDRLAEARLYVLVTSDLCRHSLEGTVSEALAGGAQVIQLREKKIDDRALLAKAREVRRLTRRYGAIFIVNDRPDIARLSEADGVHLGQDDLPVQEARRILGPEALIGVSTHDPVQIERALAEGAQYLGVGPTFRSQTKDFASLAGLEFVRQAMQSTTLPAYALGGITAANLDQVLDAGATRIAVSQAVIAAEDPRRVARELRERIELHIRKK